MTTGRKPPHNVQVLQRWVGDLAREDGIAPARLQRRISFMVVAGLLEHARDEHLDPLFVLKGGAAMELRLGLRARATKDFDATFRHAVLNMVEHLDDALRRGAAALLDAYLAPAKPWRKRKRPLQSALQSNDEADASQDG
jgi:hypothetical protein